MIYNISSITWCKCPNYNYTKPYCSVNWARIITYKHSSSLWNTFSIFCTQLKTSLRHSRSGTWQESWATVQVWIQPLISCMTSDRSSVDLSFLISVVKKKDDLISKSLSAFLHFYLTVRWLIYLHSWETW